MTDAPTTRPTKLVSACVFLAAIFAVVGVRVLLTAAEWNTTEGQERVQHQIESFQRGSMSYAEAESAYRLYLGALAFFALAGIVFAIYAIRGHRSSRVWLTIFGALLGIGSVIAGSFLSILLGVMALMFTLQLWTPEVRAHFARSREVAGGAPETTQRPDPFAVRPPSEVSAPIAPHPVGPPVAYAPHGRTHMPKPVNMALLIALIGSGVTAAFSGLAVLGLTFFGDEYERELERPGAMQDMIRDSGWEANGLMRLMLVLCAIWLVLSLLGLCAAALAYARRPVGRLLLQVMAGLTIVASAAGLPIGLATAAAAIVVLVQLAKPEARAWFVRS